AHEQPCVLLEVAAGPQPGGAGTCQRCRTVVTGLENRCVCHGNRSPYRCSKRRKRRRYAEAAKSTTQMTATIQIICRWYFAPLAQKSMRMTRMPLSAW